MKIRLFIVVLLLFAFNRIFATDYYVDAVTGSNVPGNGSSSGTPWLTITYALSHISGSGHTLHVAEGYYDTTLGETFPIYIKNGVSLDGAGDSLTVIDAGYVDGTTVLYCIGITDASTYIEGFSITGGYYYDSWTEAAGVYISAGSTLTLENNFIYDNYLGTWGTGGGIYIINSSPRILNNIIAFNGSDYWGDGDAIAIDNSSPLIKGNTIIYNISEMSYSCIYITGTSSAPRFVNNVIAANHGTGIYCLGGIPTVINNTISDNGDDGIYISGCYPDSIVNNIISFNSGYGIYESGSASDPGKVSYNLFYANSSGLYYNEGATAYYSAESLNNNVAECENNIDPDPLFEDRYNWDYHLHLYSPAIDAGDPSFPYSNEPLPNGGRINLGAYGNTTEATTSETPPVLPADLYVDAAAGSDDTGDGSSGNPWQTITYALSQIYSTGHTIHVAAGTYNSALGESFPIVMKNGVSLSGEDNTTTVIDAEGSSSNYLHVFNCIGIIDASTFIEGFTITGGYLGDYSSQGAGIYISAGSILTIRNNTIDDNYTNDDGGGIYITNSSPIILNNIISNNSAYYGNGSAIYIYGSSPQIKGNTIKNNAGTGTYNCIYISGSSSAPRLINNVIAKNSNDGIYCYSSSPTILNNTISDNTGDGIYLSSASPDSIINNIISYNSGYGIYESGTSSDPGKVWYNLFYLNTSGFYYDEGSTSYYIMSTLNSGVAECKNNIAEDPLFVDRTNNDYHLQSYSSAIDAGDPNSPYSNEPAPNGSRINIGAYGNTSEAAIYSEPPVFPADLYVNATTGNNTTGDGSSGTPWQTITYALSQIYTTGHTVHVAAGTYNTSLGETFPINMKNGISLAGTGSETTIIDAGSGSERVLNCTMITDASTLIEGFTITGGYLGDYSSQGAGIYISAGSVLTIRNNIIDDNYSSDNGGGIYITNSSPIILNNIISNNSAYYGYGSAIYIYNSSAQIKGNTIKNNAGNGTYNCIYISGSSSAPRLINNVIAKNANDGIYCSSSSPIILNNTISDNTGDGIYLSSATPDSIINNIISFNSGYGIYESGTSSDPGKVWYNLFYFNASGLYFNEGSTGYYTINTLNSGVAECENNIDGDPIFTDKAGEIYTELPYSPAIDAGDPSFPYNNEPEPNGGRINIGAYGNTGEAAIYSEPPVFPADLYVDAAAGSDDTGDGSSGNPWQTITYVLSHIYSTGHTIHVAAGTYNSALGESFPIVMKNGVSLSGEDNTTTVIDAEGSSSNYLHVFNCIGITDASTFIEGFTITGGYLGDYSSQGAGIYISAGSILTIRNNTIDDNYTNDDGGGIYITNSSPVILNNTISNNRAYYGNGSAIAIYSSSAQIKGNTIKNNAGTGTYNCIYIYGSLSKPRLIKNVIAKNTNDGISCSSSSPTILNNTISDNTGDGIYLSSATPDSIINNIISYNSGYGIYEGGTSSDPGKVWYNLYYANSTGLYYDEGSTDYYTASSLNSGVAECANNIDGDPAFTDKTNNDYHIQSGSSARDTGDPNFPNDPDGSRIDIGAYYYIIPPPDPPVATEATNVGQTDFTANWNSAATATGYYLDVATDIDFTVFVDNFENRDVQDLTSYSIVGLSSNTILYYRVRAYNEGGTSSNSNIITLTTTVDPPAPPSAPVVNAGTDITQTNFLADWETTDAATSYRIDVVVEIDPVNYVSGYYDLEVLNATELTVTGLTSNTNYYYWVRACNSGGCSSNSDTVIVSTLPDPPPAPEALDALDITQTSFTANWNSSENADGYFLDVSEEDTFDSFVSGYNYLDVSNVTGYSVTGLNANTTYYYRVEAYNTGGTGGYSETITVTTLPDPPPAPTCNDATDISQTSFTANWNSSYLATGYEIEYSTNNTFTTPVWGLDANNVTSYNITELTSNTTYYYHIRGYNIAGTGDYSDVKIVTTLPDPPPAPVALEASDTTQTSFTANWESAATATGYLLEVATDIDFTEFVGDYYGMDIYNVLSYSVTGLSPNTTYYYRITSYNEGGTGGYSDAITVTTLQVPAPAAPSANEAPFVGQTDFTASWNSSETATGYLLDVCTSSDFTSCNPYNLDVGDVTFYSIIGLTANTTYYYRVRAYNDGGTSDNSNTITVTTLLNPPDPPAAPVPNDATDITQTSFTANWNSSDNATGYKLDVATDDAFTNYVSGYEDVDLTNTTSYSITGLNAVTTYYYRLRAYNSGGTSDNSETITVTTLPWPPPVPIPDDATNITTSGFTANWQSSDGATGYILHVATDEVFTSFVAGYENLDVFDVLSYDVTGLDPYTVYYYRVSAYNTGGESGSSNFVIVTTLLEMPDLPEAPVATDAENITQTGFTAGWISSSGAEGYYLDISYDEFFSSFVTGYANNDVGNVTSIDITGLTSATPYYYRVRGYNVSGTGDNSNTIVVSTLPDPPPAPTGLTASSCSDLVFLSWDQSTEPDFDHYTIFGGTTPDPTTVMNVIYDISETTCIISGLTHGETYYFRMKTIISPDVRSDFSYAVSVKVKTGVIPYIKSKWGDVLICYNQEDSLIDFRWYIGSSLITGATKQYYVTNKQSGLYHVETTDQNGCINNSNAIYIGGSKSISVYPNPAKSYFTLNLSSEALGETAISLYNSTGMKTLEYRTEKTGTELNCEIPVGNLKDGMYMIEVIVNDTEINYTRLMIIE